MASAAQRLLRRGLQQQRTTQITAQPQRRTLLAMTRRRAHLLPLASSAGVHLPDSPALGTELWSPKMLLQGLYMQEPPVPESRHEIT